MYINRNLYRIQADRFIIRKRFLLQRAHRDAQPVGRTCRNVTLHHTRARERVLHPPHGDARMYGPSLVQCTRSQHPDLPHGHQRCVLFFLYMLEPICEISRFMKLLIFLALFLSLAIS